MTNPSDGSGINTKNNTYVANVMKLSRDVQPFMSIVSSLGYDYKTTAVSCPQSIGYGGGMGPAQFIASTWTLLMDRVVAALNLSGPANPWKPMDSFMAAGLYMSDLVRLARRLIPPRPRRTRPVSIIQVGHADMSPGPRLTPTTFSQWPMSVRTVVRPYNLKLTCCSNFYYLLFTFFYIVRMTGMTIGLFAVFCRMNFETASVILSLT